MMSKQPAAQPKRPWLNPSTQGVSMPRRTIASKANSLVDLRALIHEALEVINEADFVDGGSNCDVRAGVDPMESNEEVKEESDCNEGSLMESHNSGIL